MKDLSKSIIGVSVNDATHITNTFSVYLGRINEIINESKNINISSEKEIDEMERAKKLRLELKDIRCTVESKRKELKEESLRKGKAIDGAANIIKFMIEPAEKHLKKQEDYIKIIEKQRLDNEFNSRCNEISKYCNDEMEYNAVSRGLYGISYEEYQSILSRQKEVFNLRREKELKLKKEREEKEKREEKERKAMMEKMKKEREEAIIRAEEAEAEASKLREEEVFRMIATLAAVIGRKTMKTKYLPKGTVLIGTGKQL